MHLVFGDLVPSSSSTKSMTGHAIEGREMRKHKDRGTERVLITVHGIRTHGSWQKSVTPILNTAGFVVHPHDYGRFGLRKFVSQAARDAEIERFRALYETIVANKQFGLDPDDPTRRPSVAAHSFGTYIVAHCLRRYPYVRCDKLLLCGSIVEPQFDWGELFSRDQLNFVRNLRCMKDSAVPWAKWLVPDAGNSGIAGFDYYGTLLQDERMDDCAHSGFFSEADVREQWLRFLTRRPSEFRVIHSRNIDSEQKLDAMLTKTHAIDTKVFKNCPHYFDQALSDGVWTGWTDVNPDIYTFIVVRKTLRPVGYVGAIPVTEECYEAIIGGRKPDNELKPDDVRPFTRDTTVSLYLMSIAIDPDYHKTSHGLDSEAVERLTNGVIGKLVHYAVQRNLRVSRIAAVGWTPIGRKLCERFGMKSAGRDKFSNEIFQVDVRELSTAQRNFVHPGMKRLLSLYSTFDGRRH